MSKHLVVTDSIYNYLLDNSLRETVEIQELRKLSSRMPESKMVSAPEATPFIAWLLKLIKAERVIEVGVYTGVTSLAIAQSLDPLYLLAMDSNKEWTKLARKAWEEAGVDHKIDLRIGLAQDLLDEQLASGQGGTFDAVFIDANKDGYMDYYERCFELIRPGGILIFDNALMSGKVANQVHNELGVRVMREVLKKLHRDLRMDTSLIPVADGLALGIKR